MWLQTDNIPGCGADYIGENIMKDASPAPHMNSAMALTANVVAAYVRNHIVPLGGLSGLISEVHSALAKMSARAPITASVHFAIEKQKPAVSIRKSVRSDQITCLECGNHFKSLKRHLLAYHALSSEDYRAKWRLTPEYPMVAPAYAEARSILAREMGLGLSRRRSRGGKNVTASA